MARGVKIEELRKLDLNKDIIVNELCAIIVIKEGCSVKETVTINIDELVEWKNIINLKTS